MGHDPVAAATAAIDEANRHDPNRDGDEPLALAQGRKAERWVVELAADADDALRLAARAHHLRRWEVPRTSYPEGRAGYLRWRRDQKTRHARELGALLAEAGVDEATTIRATEIVAKRGLGTDPEVQVFEDAVSLTFLETQLASMVDRLDADHLVGVVAKTLAKMSDDGRLAAGTVDLDPASAEIVARALASS